jgi:TRAP-type C4-dicarboxylate transport system substrate-binding protein
MRKWSFLTGGAVAAVLAVGIAGAASSETLLKLGTISPPDIPAGVAIAEALIPTIENESKGSLKVEAHYRGSICTEHKCGEQARQGLIAIATTSTANFGNFAPTYAAFDLPWLFKDLDSANKLSSGWFGQEFNKRALADSGYRVWSAYPAGGFRDIGNSKRPVHVPADMKGLKMRVTKSPVEFTLIKSWGGVPVPYDFNQLYQGLQTGVVEGQYVQPPWQWAFKMHEVQPYFTRVAGAWGGNVIYMDDKAYQALSAADQKAVDAGMKAFDTQVRPLDNKWYADSTELIKAKVKEYYTPTDAEMELWRKGAVEAWKGAKGTYDGAIVEKALLEQGLETFVAALKEGKAL